MTKLKDKTVLISGASSGIGESAARLFAAAGCRLILFARRLERLESLTEELVTKYAVQVYAFQADVREKELLKKEFGRIPEHFFPIDILVNNAGLARGREKFQDLKEEAFDEVLDTNVKGVIALTRLVLPSMLERNEGQIINIGSIAGHEAYPGGHIYNASKFALRGLMDALRIDTVDTNIRISTVSPGMVNTEFSTVRYYGDREAADEVYRGIDALTALDVAEAVLFMAERPPHVNINDMVIMPNHQATANFKHYEK